MNFAFEKIKILLKLILYNFVLKQECNTNKTTHQVLRYFDRDILQGEYTENITFKR